MASASTRLSLLMGLARFGRGVGRFLAEPITPAQAHHAIRERLERREASFLTLLERTVFRVPRSPYRQLLEAAGCEPDDARALVVRHGVEGALRRLREAGVFVEFDEFKGVRPAVRGGRTLRFLNSDFDNPLVHSHYAVPSGGSRGAPTRTLIDVDYLTDRAPLWCLWFEAHGLLKAPLVFLTPYNPGAVTLHLICAKFGNRFVKWFATVRAGSLAYRLAARYLHGLATRIGRLPAPEFVNPADFRAVGECLTDMVRAGNAPCVSTAPSAAIRVAQALGGGRALEGVTFLLGFEPLTETRREAIEASGARTVMTYGFSEAGTLGQQCPNPVVSDDVHVATDSFAVIQDDETEPEIDAIGAPLLITALRPTTPKILLNASIGDSGVLETRRCDCLFDRIGYIQHLHSIRSAHKITGEGVTFLGPDVAHVLEEVLPRRFGGAPTDYQLVEQEGANGLARYRLSVSPRVGAIDGRAMKEVFLTELARRRPPYPFMVEQWARTVELVVEYREPVLTSRGKLLPFRTLRSS
jgi:hypothetical protein